MRDPHSRQGRPSAAEPVPGAVRLAARALGLAVAGIAPLGGATGSTWGCPAGVLRVGDRDRLAREVTAMRAAAAAVPVPALLDMVEFRDEEGRALTALLLQPVPGHAAGDLDASSPARARRIGAACGTLHAALAAVPAPPGIPDARGVAVGDGDVSTLLHLDLHPFNVLVDEIGDVVAVLDWANAAAGPAIFDRARSWAILTLDPTALRLREDPRYAALRRGWARSARFSEVPPAARVWAAGFMLDELAARHPPAHLEHIRRFLADQREHR